MEKKEQKSSVTDKVCDKKVVKKDVVNEKDLDQVAGGCPRPFLCPRNRK